MGPVPLNPVHPVGDAVDPKLNSVDAGGAVACMLVHSFSRSGGASDVKLVARPLDEDIIKEKLFMCGIKRVTGRLLLFLFTLIPLARQTHVVPTM